MDTTQLMDVTQWSGEVTTLVEAAIAWALLFLPRVTGALLLLIVGWWIAARANRAVARLLGAQTRIDPTLRTVISSLVRYSILVIVLVAVLGQLGIQTTSILAALGAIGLAIGLALQGTLANIAAGMMLLWLRPFRVGDYIDTGAVAGTVMEVGLFASELHSWDGVYQFVPNAELWNRRIVNYSRLGTRLVDVKFGVAYADDIGKGKETLLRVAGDDARTRADPAPAVFVDELGDSAVVLRLRVWAANADYWDLRRALTENGKAALEGAGLTIPFPQRDLHIRDAPEGTLARAAA
jgi:small conductance mechanosensitive channel